MNDSTMSYEAELQEAIERTTSWGLQAPNFVPTHERYVSPASINTMTACAGKTIGPVPPEMVDAQCFAVHHDVMGPLEKALGIPLLYTIGYVSFDSRPMFHTEVRELKALLDSGKQVSGLLNLHAWLTLPSHEILDLTFGTTAAVREGRADMMGTAIFCHPSTLTGGQRYHPQLVGNDYFHRIGAIVELRGYAFG